MQSRRVVIIGAGPAGIFAAIELVRGGVGDITIVEKGKGIEERRCPGRENGCIGCPECDVMSGWGGAGAYSDGKLTLTGDAGGWLSEYIGGELLKKMIAEADEAWLEYGADPHVHEPDPSHAARLEQEAALAGMQLTPMRIRHLGTDRLPEVMTAMRAHLEEENVRIMTGTEAVRILAAEGAVDGAELADGSVLKADAVVVAPGRAGADWLAEQASSLGIRLSNNAVDIGLRVECPAAVMEPLTDYLYEAKLKYSSRVFGDRVRTFCMNPYGEVTTESYDGVVTVNGHSFAEEKTEYTNFAVLVSQSFTEPFKEPITYGRSIARLANLLGDGILAQRLGDLRAGRRSTPERIADSTVVPTMPSATPGDLSFVLPYRNMTDILEFIDAMDSLVPGVSAPSTLLYGVEVKFYSSRLELDSDLMTPVEGLYAVGDGAGVTRGLIQSSASGMVAARAILGG